MKKVLVVVGFIVLVGGVLLFLTRTLYPDNMAQTLPDGGVKGLKTREYRVDLAEMVDAVKETIPTLSSWGSNWKLAGEQIDVDTAAIKAEVPVVVFTDDLTVNLKQEGDSVIVNIRSASRVGQSDLGENRRHVAKLLEALDARFGRE